MNKKLFYLLNLTWGSPLTLCGAVVALYLRVTGHHPHRWGGCWYFNVGRKSWGGLNLGLVFLTDHNDSVYTKNHEFGHAIQNCYLGPLILPLVLCSAIRYHYLDYLEDKGKPVPLYDSWWFEGQATKLGTRYHLEF